MLCGAVTSVETADFPIDVCRSCCCILRHAGVSGASSGANHQSDVRRYIQMSAGVYDRHSYFDEKDAVERLAMLVKQTADKP